MRLIDADHLRRWILSRVFKTQLSVADVIDQIDREDTIELQPEVRTFMSSADDLISRTQAIDAICDNCDTVKASCPHYPCGRYVAIEKLPPAQPKTGRWIKHNTGHSIYYDCSRCGCVAPCTETADKILWKLSNYCPDCGVKMQEEEDDRN